MSSILMPEPVQAGRFVGGLRSRPSFQTAGMADRTTPRKEIGYDRSQQGQDVGYPLAG